jgi:hypothetical protein
MRSLAFSPSVSAGCPPMYLCISFAAAFEFQFFLLFSPFTFFSDAIFLVSSLSRAFDNFFSSEFHSAAKDSRSALS